MKRFYDILGVTVFSAAITLFMYCNRDKKPVPSKEAVLIDSVHYKTGQIILPDYACPDSLIVTDGRRLTDEMNNLLLSPDYGTDSDIDSVLHNSACTYHINSGLQPINFDTK